ncbi:MAG: bi-domain-containing oxidoreductase [Janthinobacterium lividum]
MKQLLQNLKTGHTSIVDIPAPSVSSNGLIIKSCNSLISSGTERMLVEFGQSSWLGKIKSQPDKVKVVLNKIKSEGLLTTFETIQSKLDQPISMGYSNVGVVAEIGRHVTSFKIGDRVVSNGSHADLVSVPTTLCALIPESVSDTEASFSVLGAIAMQGIRLASPTIGETFAVFGTGILGLLTIQILRANGCRVIALDFDEKKLSLAKEFGAEIVNLKKGEDPLSFAHHLTQGRGIDGAILTLSTKSHDPIHQAATMCRKRGRIILVGVTGLELSRADFYEKELTFQVSCSYGPGRYDDSYEQDAQDYPFGFVRWTAQRNMEAFLDLLADQRINLNPLISHRFEFSQADLAYKLITSDEWSLGILLDYPKENKNILERTKSIDISKFLEIKQNNHPNLAFIGAGNYISRILIPQFSKTSAQLHTISSKNGISSNHVGTKYKFHHITTNTESIFKNPDVSAVVIGTRHDSHAHWICKSLDAGKHVFVEKPLVVTFEELEKVKNCYLQKIENKNILPILMVGFNRRFSPFILKIKELLDTIHSPKSFIMTVNAGSIPSDHWTQSRSQGGRIIGEACHFVDLLRYLANSRIIKSYVISQPNLALQQSDCVTISLGFEDGSWGSINYISSGHSSYAKEVLQVFCEGKILVMDNYLSLKGYGWNKFKSMKRWRQDKGQNICVENFVQSISSGKSSPISIEEIFEVAQVTIDIAEQTWA